MVDGIYLASYKAKGDWVDKLIRFFTKGKYSHTEIAVVKNKKKEAECYSSSPRDGGVRVKNIDVFDESKWDLLPLKEVAESDVKTYFEQTKGTKYDFFGAIGTKLLIRQSRSKVFCSEWAFNLIFKSNEGWRFDPSQLHAIVKGR